MTRPDLTELHRAWARHRFAHDELVALNGRPELGMAFAIDVLVFLPGEDDEAPQTWFCTAGVSRMKMVSDVGTFELQVAVRGRPNRPEREAMARRVAELALAPIKREHVVRGETVFEDIEVPLFPGQTVSLWVDAGWSTPEHLPGVKPRVRILEVFFLHPREAVALRRLGPAETILRFRELGTDLIAPRREPVDLLREPHTGEGPPLKYQEMGTKQSKRDVPAIWADIDRWLSAKAPATFKRLKPGAAPAALADVEKAIGKKLPPDLAASYQVHDGFAYLTDYEYLPCAVGLKRWNEQASAKGAKPAKAAHQGKLKPQFWNKGWFPVAMDSGGNFLCVDLDPADGGTAGQVLFWDAAEGPRVSEHDSFGSWLETYRNALLAGRFTVDEDGRLEPPIDPY